MSAERYSTLDEPSLRNLLDGTMDLDERRLIRSAIRELRRREIEDMEAALASKRFRHKRLNQNDDKENQLTNRSDLGDSLNMLSVKLQAIQDMEELTGLLRGATEYEERKLIRAAIRRLRDEEQQGTGQKGGTTSRCLESEGLDLQNSLGAGDTERESFGERERIKSQIRELRSHQTQQGRELHRTGSNSGMVLVLDPLVRKEVSGPLLNHPKIWDPETSSEVDVVLSHRQCSDSTSSDHTLAPRPRLDSGASEKSLGLGSAFRTRVDSGASEKSLGLGSAFRTRVDSGASEKSLGLGSAFRTRVDSGASEKSLGLGSACRTRVDSGASEKSLGLGSAFRTRVDSGSSNRSQCSVHRGRLDSGASESRFRPRLDSGTSDSSTGPPAPLGSETSDSAGLLSRKRLDSGTSDLSVGVSSVERGRVEEPEVTMSSSSSSTDSEAESTNHHSAQPRQDRSTTNCDQPDGAVPSRKASDSHSTLLNGSSKGKGDIQEQKVRDTLFTTLSKASDAVPEKKPVVLAPFGRANSVRDRMRKFTEPSPSPSVPFLKRGSQSLRNGTAPSARVLGRATELSEGRAAGPVNQTAMTTAVSIRSLTDRHGRPHVGSTSYSSSSSSSENLVQCQGTIQPGGVATKDLQTAAQSMSSVGGAKQPAKKLQHSSGISKEDKTPGNQGEADPDMKTFLTIEIKDGRTITSSSSCSSSSSSRSNLASMTPIAQRVTTNSLGQRAELTMGLRATPFKTPSSLTSGSSFKMETEPVMASEPVFAVEPSVQVACCQAPATVPNGSSAARAKVEERSGKLTAEQLAAIDDEELLDKMLDESKDFEERKMIRQAMRDLRKRKREAVLGCTQEEIDQREKEREVRLVELRQQREERAQKGRTGGGGAEEVVMRKVEKSADGSTLSQVTKTNHFAQSGDGSRTAHSTIMEASYVKKTDMGTVQSKSYSYSSTSSSSARKVGSVFDREDDTASRAAERRQAEKRKELMRAQSLPKTSAAQSRKAMIEKLEKESGGPGNKAVAKVNMVQRSASCVVPNANSIKQMLLDWCRAKTRSYENVDIQNFSSSWSDGMAFCALVHNFFPEAFDYSSLTAANRRHNFEVAFSTAEKLADCPELLDVEDMVRMREPDWKCVYTYLQEFYRGLVTKGLVKTKNSS
ncbi:smoothelin isoform X2 [Oncorhynchus tshawytscha]|uniref:Calponin-homology (CH) domain-containing protein n=1 Tax=Oncorhynchus tshawytscha TaxID=74940 RepID=A0A8C8IY43_ONCTS|nr:smoothelin isoform X2 [Oncorhynchus tshawytscha]